MKFKKKSVLEFRWLFMQRKWSGIRITQLVGLRWYLKVRISEAVEKVSSIDKFDTP